MGWRIFLPRPNLSGGFWKGRYPNLVEALIQLSRPRLHKIREALNLASRERLVRARPLACHLENMDIKVVRALDAEIVSDVISMFEKSPD
jgi:hypothetical protein